MHALFPALLALLLLPLTAIAAPDCSGTDLGSALSEAERREIRALSDATPYSRGNRWVARRGAQTIHLIGTLHFNDPRMEDIAARLAPLFGTADLLMMEVDRDSQLKFASAGGMSAFLLTEGPSLIDLMGDEVWAQTATVLRRARIAPWMAAKMQPWLVAQLLSVPGCLRQDKSLSEGLDRQLEAIARDTGTPVRSLETPQEVLTVLNAAPLNQQVEDLVAALPGYGGTLDYYTTMQEGYFAEDIVFLQEVIRRHAKAHSLDRISGEIWERQWQRLQVSLLENRNALWMPRILARPERTIVIAVGAAHLSGETGLLTGLERAGYSLTRAPF